jgi:hypothetical protein
MKLGPPGINSDVPDTASVWRGGEIVVLARSFFAMEISRRFNTQTGETKDEGCSIQ